MQYNGQRSGSSIFTEVLIQLASFSVRQSGFLISIQLLVSKAEVCMGLGELWIKLKCSPVAPYCF
jgi:hypothetical protein